MLTLRNERYYPTQWVAKYFIATAVVPLQPDYLDIGAPTSVSSTSTKRNQDYCALRLISSVIIPQKRDANWNSGTERAIARNRDSLFSCPLPCILQQRATIEMSRCVCNPFGYYTTITDPDIEAGRLRCGAGIVLEGNYVYPDSKALVSRTSRKTGTTRPGHLNQAPIQHDRQVVSHGDMRGMASSLPKRLFALTIGIDEYLDEDTGNLKGAASDADSVVQLLIEKGVASERIRSLRNKQATRIAIRRELTDLITNPSIEENDPIVIYFAGHGNNMLTPKEWKNWDSEVQCLVPHDFNEPDGKGGIIHGIPDRALGTILHRIANAKGNNITVILDCCHSGSGTRNAGTLVRSAPPSRKPIPANIDEDLFSGEAFSLTRGAHVLPKFRHHGIESHILLAACKPEELAHEFQGQGQFTAALLHALKSLDIGSITYSELVRQFKVLPRQNPQCEGKVDRLLFSNDLRSMKGYYTAKLELVKDDTTKKPKGAKTPKKLQFQVEAGLIHGITADAVFDIWTGLPAISGPPLYTCNAIKVTPLRTTLNWRGDLQPPQTFIAKPHKSTKPTLKYHASEDYKAILLDKQQAENLTFCLKETTRELADVSLSKISENYSYEILAPEESEHYCEPKELERLGDVWDLMKSVAFYYHHLRHDNPVAVNITVGDEKRAFMSMFDVEVYRLEDTSGSMEIVSGNLNHPGNGVHIFIDGDDDDSVYGFKITNTSTFDVYPHLFYFNSNDLSITSFYKTVNVGNQQIDQPLKARQSLTVGWGAGGTVPQSFGVDEETGIENGFLKLYITQDYVNLDIEQTGLQDSSARGVKTISQKDQSPGFWGAIRIPFVLERKRETDGDEDVTRGEDEGQGDPMICLLGTNNAKAPVGSSMFIGRDTEELEGVKVHKLSLEDGSSINLIDIPAFEDASLESNTTLCQSLIQFSQKHESSNCNALVFAYDISKARVERNDILNFGLVKDLCGDPFYKNIAILTTNWHRGTPSESFERRESELRDRPDYCSGLIDNGAQLHRCSPDASTSTLLSALSAQEPIPLAIQIDAQCRLHITKTAIGATLRTRLNESIEENRKRAQDMRQELEDASCGLDEALPEDEVEAIKMDLRTAQKETKKLREILTEMESIALN
ncbi:caspase domain-containing protein [Coprinopsis sp. MPI-PUGE-AT-0042]|nr:caspase domain-containing protein [Coprinopsis sp. MPI-PUGE-AT-0042]